MNQGKFFKKNENKKEEDPLAPFCVSILSLSFSASHLLYERVNRRR
jgi:hypothetical protein